MQTLLAAILCVLLLGLIIKLACTLLRLAFRVLLWFIKLALVAVCVLSVVYFATQFLPAF